MRYIHLKANTDGLLVVDRKATLAATRAHRKALRKARRRRQRSAS